jgi:hypothetical protein
MATEAEKNLRELGIDPGELYDGPNPNVAQFPGTMSVALNVPQPTPISRAGYVDTITAALNVLSARLLGMIATLGAVLMFGWAVYDPDPWRLAAVGTYAAVVLWPIVFLYLRRG